VKLAPTACGGGQIYPQSVHKSTKRLAKNRKNYQDAKFANLSRVEGKERYVEKAPRAMQKSFFCILPYPFILFSIGVKKILEVFPDNIF